MEEEGIMPNPLERRRLKDRIIDSISKAVKFLQQYQYNPIPGSEESQVLSNPDWQFHKLAEHLDHAFLHGLRHITSGYWVVVKEFTHKSTVKEISLLQNVTTNLGKGRAWLYMALNDHLLESYTRCFLDNTKLVKKHYVKEALVLDQQRMQILLTLAAGLETIKFELNTDMPYLDLSTYCKPKKSQSEDSVDRLSFCSMESSASLSSSVCSTNSGRHSLNDICSGLCDGASAIDPSPHIINGISEADPVLTKPTLKNSQSLPVIEDREMEEERLERISKIQTITRHTSLTAESTDDDVGVIRVRSKGTKMKKKCVKRKENTLDPDCVSVNSINSNASGVISSSLTTPESGYRSVAGGCSPKFSDKTDSFDNIMTSSGSTEASYNTSHTDKCVEDRDSRIPLPSQSANVETGGLHPCNLPVATSSEQLHRNSELKQNTSSVYDDSVVECDYKDSHSSVEEDKDVSKSKSITVTPDIYASKESKYPLESSCHLTPRNLFNSSDSVAEAKKGSESSTQIPVCLQSEMCWVFSQDKPNDKKTHLDNDHLHNTAAILPNVKEAAGSNVSVPSDLKSPPRTKSTPITPKETTSVRRNGPEISVDNNTMLILMLEVFREEDEKFVKMYLTCTGHTEGGLQPVFLLITDRSLYILTTGYTHTKFKKEAHISYKEIDYISLSINYQVINIVCTNRRKQFWITTGDEELTSKIIHQMDIAIRRSEADLSRLSILTDATTQKIALKKWAAAEAKVTPCEISLLCYVLVHWEDAQAISYHTLSVGAVKEGTLLLKSAPGMLFAGSWIPGYFILKEGILYLYDDKHSSAAPKQCIKLSYEECGGCRRYHTDDREHCFEIILGDGSSLQLSAQDEQEQQDWLMALCQAVSEGMGMRLPSNGCLPCCCVLTRTSVLMCHEDVQTNFFRTLGSANILDVTGLLSDPGAQTYCVLLFESHDPGVTSEQWILYFNTQIERDRFVKALSQAWMSHFEVSLPVMKIDDNVLQKRCREGICNLKQLRKV